MTEPIPDPTKGQSDPTGTTTPPAAGQSPGTSAPQGGGQASDNLPEKFKGKSASDIAQSYIELEKKLGEHSASLKEKEEYEKEVKAWRQLLEASPELASTAKREYDRLTQPQAATTTPATPVRDDTRKAVEGTILSDFRKEYGFHLLTPEKQVELDKRVGKELADLIDPTGTKNSDDIVKSIPLDRLPALLSKAYKLATLDDREEMARSQAYLEKRRNDEASFGSFASSGTKGGEVNLTPSQREAARRLGVSEEDYKKQLAAG